MTTSQKLAIGYAKAKMSKKRREEFLISKEGTLDGFKKSKYKSIFYYIKNKYGTMIY
ncbi:MAG: hypothetical protein IJX51_00985 [Clostridia bacterium]|nr:hypothetical protein [Clostridia bacterium]